MWTYLWDLVDEGYPNVLGRLKEIGMSGISLATAYHAGKFLEPHNPKRRVVFTEDGTVYFNPNRKRYGLVQPRINSLVRDGHGLARTMKEAEKFGLKSVSGKKESQGACFFPEHDPQNFLVRNFSPTGKMPSAPVSTIRIDGNRIFFI